MANLNNLIENLEEYYILINELKSVLQKIENFKFVISENSIPQAGLSPEKANSQ
jgi:hypothetical protein